MRKDGGWEGESKGRVGREQGSDDVREGGSGGRERVRKECWHGRSEGKRGRKRADEGGSNGER